MESGKPDPTNHNVSVAQAKGKKCLVALEKAPADTFWHTDNL